MSQTIILRCPECERRCQVKPRDKAFQIRCKRCDAPIRVPAREGSSDGRATAPADASASGRAAQTDQSKRIRKNSLAEADRKDGRSVSRKSSPQRRSKSSSKVVVPLRCPDCRTNFTTGAHDYGKSIPCPLCNTSIHVPDPYEPIRQKTRKPKSRVSDLIAGDIAPAAPERTDKLPTGLMLYIEGVLTFPFQPEVIFRLIMFAVLIFLLDATVDACVYSFKTVPYALRAFAPAALAMFLLVGANAAVTFQAIFDETAAGSKDVRGWIEFDKNEYFFRLLSIGWIFAVSAVIGYIPFIVVNVMIKYGRLEFGWDFSPQLILFTLCFLVTMAVFPLMALSSFEQHSMMGFYSPQILKSLFREWWSWLIVIAVTWLFFLPWILMRMFGAWEYPIFNLLFLSPYFAFIFFVYSRLLGRLAYKIAQSADWD